MSCALLQPASPPSSAQERRPTFMGGMDAVDELGEVDAQLAEPRPEARRVGLARGVEVRGHRQPQVAFAADRPPAELGAASVVASAQDQ